MVYRTVKNDYAVLVFDASDIIENFRILFKNLDEHEAVVKKFKLLKMMFIMLIFIHQIGLKKDMTVTVREFLINGEYRTDLI